MAVPLAALLVLTLLTSSEQLEQPECTAVWEAAVVETGTGEALPGTSLVLRSTGRTTPIYTRSDDAGEVVVVGLCPGEMLVSATKDEHLAARMVVSLGPLTTTSVIELEPLHARHSEDVITVHVHGDTPTNMSASEAMAGAELARERGKGLADALDRMSGVSTLRGIAGGMGKPIIRGQLGRRNLVIVDGVRHEGQDWGIDHAPEVDPYSADRISVIKGASTTRFGAKAIGGVVLLEPRPLPQRPSLRTEVSTVGYSNPLGGGGSARIDYAPLRGRGFGMRVEGNLSRHRATVSPTYALDNTGAMTWNAGTLLGYSSDAFDLGVGYHIMSMRGGICSCLQISSPAEFQRSAERSRPIVADFYRADFAIDRAKQEIWHHLALARTRVKLGRVGELHGLYAFQFNDRKEFDVVRQSVVGPQLDFGLATHSGELRFEHARVPVGEAQWVGSLGSIVSHQANQFRAATTLIPDYRHTNWAVYDIERFIYNDLEVEFGARYEGLHRVTQLRERDFLSQQAGGRLDADACKPGEGGSGICTHNFHTASGMFGTLARPLRRVPEFTWRTQLNSSARIPSIDEQFMNGAAPSFPILGVGNSNIGVERLWGGESIVQYDGDWLFVEGAGYANYIHNYVYFVPERQDGQCAPLSCTSRGPLPVFAFQAIDAMFAGGELRFDLRAPRLPFGISGNAAWVRAFDLRTDQHLVLIPADRYALAARYYAPDTRVSGRGYVELGATLVTRQRNFQPDLDFSPPPPAYVLLGAGAGIEFLGNPEVYRLSLVGTNLLNMRYRDYTSLLRYFADEAGWGLQLRLSVDVDILLDTPRNQRSRSRRRGRQAFT